MNEPELYSEQDVMSKVIVPDLAALGYDETKRRTNKVILRFNHPITVQQGRERKTIFADLVVFVGDVPVIVVDAKNPRAFLTENDREQAVSYARLLPNIAPYAALCNGTWQVFDSIRKQQIRALPTLTDLLRDLQRRRLTASERKGLIYQATRTLFAIDSARELSRLMRRCHDIIRNLKGYDPTKAFDELSKILFAKMYEEKELDEGRRKVNRFTIEAVREMRRQGVEIIQTLWKDTITSPRYREVFADESVDSSIELPSEAIDRIVEILQGKSLGLTDLDVKGVAFEEFLSATYRGGELGQYFTTREVVNFMVDLVEPRIGECIIDPSCGSGGFLIRAYNVVRDKILLSDLSEREKTEKLRALATRSLVGIDWETRAARTCKMNMIIHGDGHAGVYQAHALDLSEVEAKVQERQRYYPDAPAIDEGTFDVVLTNPPFGAKDESARILRPYELGKGKSQKREVLLLE
jgi:type I restriction enzyme M protein